MTAEGIRPARHPKRARALASVIACTLAPITLLALPVPAHAQAGATTSETTAPTAAAPEDWTQLGSYLPPSMRDAPVVVDDASQNDVLLFGGETPQPGGVDSDTWTWNGAQWTQRYPSNAPSPRVYAAAAYDAEDGQVVLFGGEAADGAVLGDTWTWNGATWSEQSTADSPPARMMASMAYDPASGEIVLFGGAALDEESQIVPLGDTWTWNGTNWTEQLTAAPSPSPRYLAGFADGSASLAPVLFGGQTAASTSTGDTWIWNGDTDSWTPQLAATLNGPPARSAGELAYDPALGESILYGGLSNATVETGGGCEPVCSAGTGLLGDTWAWNGTQWTQLSPTNTPSTAWFFGMAFDPVNGELLQFIGFSGQLGWENATWEFSGATWTLVDLNAPPPLLRPMLAREPGDPDGAMLFGGINQYGISVADTWRWNGDRWDLPDPATAPSPRSAATMVYDPAINRTILFGGLVSEETCTSNGCSPSNQYWANDTWSWDGSTWTQLSPADSPPARENASMAYDPATGQMVLFGGSSESGVLGDTWTFDGTNWTQQQPLSAPPARSSATLDYDPATANVVLFGGTDQNGDYFDDTWVWGGSDWSQLQPGHTPGARAYQTLAWDPSSQSLILFGGCSSDCFNTVDADTWRWDGATWTQVVTVHAPPGRTFAASVDGDPSAPMLLFGGQLGADAVPPSGTDALNDVWSLGIPAPNVEVPESPSVPALLLAAVGLPLVLRRRRRGRRAHLRKFDCAQHSEEG